MVEVHPLEPLTAAEGRLLRMMVKLRSTWAGRFWWIAIPSATRMQADPAGPVAPVAMGCKSCSRPTALTSPRCPVAHLHLFGLPLPADLHNRSSSRQLE